MRSASKLLRRLAVGESERSTGLLRLRFGMGAMAALHVLFWVVRAAVEPPGTLHPGLRAGLVGVGLAGCAFTYWRQAERFMRPAALLGGGTLMVLQTAITAAHALSLEYVASAMVLYFALGAVAVNGFELAFFTAGSVVASTLVPFLYGWRSQHPPLVPLLMLWSASVGGGIVSWFRLRSQATLTLEIARRQAVECELRGIQAHLEGVNRELERADRAKDAFLANLSHELRTPLSVIIGYLNLVLDGGLAAEETRQFVERSSASAEHLLRLISDMLDLTRLEAGALDVVLEPLTVQPLVDDVRDLTQVLADRKALTLATAVEPTTRVVADRQRLKQILLNLVGNALKFTTEGGVTIAAAAHNGRVEFSVRDTGCGVPPEQQSLLFRKFMRLDTRPTAPEEGVGLGLSICRELVALMGGEISLFSEGQGKGTEVRFTLPSVDDARAPLAPSGTERAKVDRV